MIRAAACFARASLGVALVTTLLTACSGSSSSSLSKTDPLGSIVTAMQNAKSGKISGTINGQGSKSGPLSGEWKGGATGEQDTHATLITTSGTELPTEIRVVNDIMYFSRTVATLPATEPLALFSRAENFKVWRQAKVEGVITIVPVAFSPGALVEHLQQLKIPVKTSSGGKVGNTSTTRVTTTRPIAIGVWLGATVDLWVDTHARIVQVQITTPANTGAHYEVTDFGAPVSVTPPPSSAIGRGSEVPVKKPAGPFAPVQSGNTNGVRWTVLRAPGTAGTECWKWQANPPLAQTGVKKPADPICVTPATKDSDPEDTVYFPVDGNGGGSYDALVVVTPPGSKDLTLGFVGGKMQRLSGSPVAVWVGPTNPTKGYVGVTLPDGTKLDCGAGAISVPADLNDSNVTNSAAGAPWGCLQHQS